MNAGVMLRDFVAWGPDATGPTRAVALLRIGLATMAIVRFGAEVAPFAAETFSELLLGLVFFIFAIAALLGVRARLSIGLLGLTIFLLYGMRQAGLGTAGWNHHHVYLLGISCIFLMFTDCGRSYSFDRWTAIQSGNRILPEHGILWGQRLIALQMSALYFWTAVDKSDQAFISGQRLEQIFVWSYSGRTLEILLASPMLLALMSCAVLVVEYFLAYAILTRRHRATAIFIGLSMHSTFYLLLPVSTYSATMMLLYLALLDPQSVQKFTKRIQEP
ncbi:HTTM domain-containing protein [Sulfitobacter sp. D7]|jgi:hypothetical protein|uniref:HTTM domain-containing protein n=1 Tax=Sulfitobacter sp. D7 TaxID=1968541 RepID=UPI000E77B162|nr:HTTM domain-containing protein [Sulfitobacter sp. D7]AYE86769.1 hypothetical protein B5M07_11970 [Sulfitobacter sp. D7]